VCLLVERELSTHFGYDLRLATPPRVCCGLVIRTSPVEPHHPKLAIRIEISLLEQNLNSELQNPRVGGRRDDSK
jgi:hypothetical protein